MDKLIITLEDSNLLDVQLQNVVTHIGGNDDYEQLQNKPKINGVTLTGDTSLDTLGVQPQGVSPEHILSDDELDAILI